MDNFTRKMMIEQYKDYEQDERDRQDKQNKRIAELEQRLTLAESNLKICIKTLVIFKEMFEELQSKSLEFEQTSENLQSKSLEFERTSEKLEQRLTVFEDIINSSNKYEDYSSS